MESLGAKGKDILFLGVIEGSDEKSQQYSWSFHTFFESSFTKHMGEVLHFLDTWIIRTGRSLQGRNVLQKSKFSTKRKSNLLPWHNRILTFIGIATNPHSGNLITGLRISPIHWVGLARGLLPDRSETDPGGHKKRRTHCRTDKPWDWQNYNRVHETSRHTHLSPLITSHKKTVVLNFL